MDGSLYTVHVVYVFMLILIPRFTVHTGNLTFNLMVKEAEHFIGNNYINDQWNVLYKCYIHFFSRNF